MKNLIALIVALVCTSLAFAGNGTPGGTPPPISETREPVTMFDGGNGTPAAPMFEYQRPTVNAGNNAAAYQIVLTLSDGTVARQYAVSPATVNWRIQMQSAAPMPWGGYATVGTPKKGVSSASNQVWNHSNTISKIANAQGAPGMSTGGPNFGPADFSYDWDGTGKYAGWTHRVAVWIAPGQDPMKADAAFVTLLEAALLKFPEPTAQ